MKTVYRVIGCWLYWRYNVHELNTGKPLRELGKVTYAVDNFGNLVLSSKSQLGISLRN